MHITTFAYILILSSLHYPNVFNLYTFQCCHLKVISFTYKKCLINGFVGMINMIRVEGGSLEGFKTSKNLFF